MKLASQSGDEEVMMSKDIVFSDNLPFLQSMASESVDLIYIDPPFNTGKRQERRRIKVEQDIENGDRIGFNGKKYRTQLISESGFDDYFDSYLEFLRPRLQQARRVLKPSGSLFFHIDFREVHYCKVLLDEIFGRSSFKNEIIWAYDYGGRSRKRWSPKHNNILWYAKDPELYTFHYDEMDRIPYMAPGLVGKEKAARGKTPTDVWWHTIVSPTGKEKAGYATQKPLGIIERIIKVHSSPGDLLLDFFAGSGTLGEAAAKNNRSFILVDNNPDAIVIMTKRLRSYKPEVRISADMSADALIETGVSIIQS
jgi:site-specific DNA-methyltransferase (adenine-specific)